MKKATKSDFQTTHKERLSYPLYFVGQNVFFVLVTTYLNTYLLDIGLKAIAISILFLAVKVWDAINDPIFGGIVDKLKLKGGKFLPWLRMSILAIPVATLLLFLVPSSLSDTAKLIWAAVAYILWDTAYTICDVPIFGIVTTLTNEQAERSSILSYGRVAGVLSALVATILVPMIREPLGGWGTTVIVLAILGAAFMLPICITAKERVKPIALQEDVGLREMFRFLVKNKYLLIFYVAFCLWQMMMVGNSLALIMARELLGNESAASLLTLMTLLPTVVFGVFIPRILRKVDKFNLYVTAVAVNGLLGLLIFFVGYQNFNLYLILLAIKGIPFGISFVLMFMFTPDCVEYGTYTSGISSSGIGFSVQTFSAKLAAAIAVSLGAFCLAKIGYIEGEGAVQTAVNFKTDFWFIYTLLPVIGSALSLAILSRYKLRDKYVQIMMKANTGEITREEAERLLEGKF